MTGHEYQKLAMRTNDGKATNRVIQSILTCNMEYPHRQNFVRKEDTIYIGGVLNGCLGLSGESGETLDMIKKFVFHEKELDEEHLKKELGDVMWYVAMICESVGFDLDDVMQTNVDKLKARYPEGFDTYLANHRKEGDI